MYIANAFARAVASHAAETPEYGIVVARHRARRVELNRMIRQNTAAMNSIPALANKPWARAWRNAHQHSYRWAIRRCRRELDQIAKLIGPPPAFFKLAATSAADRRIARRFDADATPRIYWRAWQRLAQLRAAA
jgi:hypothetical protein